METEKVTIPELLTLKYLTESIPPFHTIYKQFLKNLKVNVLHGAPKALKTMADEFVVRFLLIFIRDHRDIFMRFMDEPLGNLSPPEELKSIHDHWGSDVYAISIIALGRWLSSRFTQSLTKEEINVLASDFETSLNDAKELIVSAKLFLVAIRDSLKKGWLTKDEVINFLDANREDREPRAYDRSVNFLSRLPSDIQKTLGDALVVERNYLSRQGLFAHLQRIEEAILGKYFLDTLKTHASKLARAVGERAGERIAWAYDIYYQALARFKRIAEGHFEHFLNVTLLGERKHALSAPEKIIYRDDAACPFCGYGLGEILKGKKSGSIECPSCKVSVGVWAFQNDLVPMSELPDSFFKDPFEKKGTTYRVRSFTPTIEVNLSELLDQYLEFGDVSLTEKESEVIEAIRDADGQGVSMSKVLRRIASEQGKSEHTLREHYKRGVKKLKNLHKKH